jgi:hypothetical protein
LNSEYIVSCAAKLRVLAYVATKVEVIDEGEILKEVFPHAVEGKTFQKAVVAYEADNSIPALEPINGPSKKFYIYI